LNIVVKNNVTGISFAVFQINKIQAQRIQYKIKIQGTRYKVHDTRYKIQGTRYKVLDTRYRVQDLPKCRPEGQPDPGASDAPFKVQ
jgi:hypothetical protein